MRKNDERGNCKKKRLCVCTRAPDAGERQASERTRSLCCRFRLLNMVLLYWL